MHISCSFFYYVGLFVLKKTSIVGKGSFCQTDGGVSTSWELMFVVKKLCPDYDMPLFKNIFRSGSCRDIFHLSII